MMVSLSLKIIIYQCLQVQFYNLKDFDKSDIDKNLSEAEKSLETQILMTKKIPY